VKNDSTLTLARTREQFEYPRQSRFSIAFALKGRLLSQLEGDHEGEKEVETGLLAILLSFIPDTHPSNRLACVPCICSHVAHSSAHRGWGDTKAIGGDRVSRAPCNHACFHGFCHRDFTPRMHVTGYSSQSPKHRLRADDVARGVVVAMLSIIYFEP
jgi:hypothetical protein